MPPPKSLCQQQYIRHNAKMLKSKQLARAAKSGLDLV
jgi:hypothetical protein